MAKQIDPQFKVRIPPDMDRWLEEQARLNHRSKTAEIAYRLNVARRVEEAAGTASRA